MKYIYIIVILIFSIFNQSFSQTLKEDSVSENKFYIGVNLSYFKSKIDAVSDITFSSKHNFSLTESLELGYYFSKNIGISVGFGMSSYKTDLTLGSYNEQFDATDDDIPVGGNIGETFQMTVASSNITENQKISYFDLPISLLFKFGKKMGFYLNPGIKFSFLRTGDYTGKGIFSYEGYYSQYNITLNDIPEYGFPADLSIDKSGDIKLLKQNKSLIVTGGLFLQLGKFNISLGAYYDRSIGNISEENENFILSENPDNYNSLIGSSTKTLTQGMGVSLSIKYFLRYLKSAG